MTDRDKAIEILLKLQNKIAGIEEKLKKPVGEHRTYKLEGTKTGLSHAADLMMSAFDISDSELDSSVS